jgi:hypothetical protein
MYLCALDVHVGRAGMSLCSSFPEALGPIDSILRMIQDFELVKAMRDLNQLLAAVSGFHAMFCVLPQVHTKDYIYRIRGRTSRDPRPHFSLGARAKAVYSLQVAGRVGQWWVHQYNLTRDRAIVSTKVRE